MKKFLNAIRIILFFVFLGIFCFSAKEVFVYFNNASKADDFREEIIQNAVETVDIPEVSTVVQVSSDMPISTEDKKIPISKYPNIKVDLGKVQKSYPETVGWLYCPDTPIHYPVMQGKDNDYYIDKLSDGTKNPAGSLFMDYRHKSDLSGFCQVIYGHNMKNRSMFGSILDYRKEGYFSAHPYMFYFTSDGNYRLEIFAGVNTVSDSEFYFPPTDMDARQQYINRALSKSVFSADISVSAEDKLMILSTCSGDTGSDKRFIILGKLVPLGN